MNNREHIPRPSLLVGVFACCLVTPNAAASTMDALLEGNELRLQYRDGSIVDVQFDANGTYRTSTGSGGTWTLDGEALCTVRTSDDHSSCGVLDANKSVGEAWASTDAHGVPVTASVKPVR